MEREVREAGLGGWFNRMEQRLPESWSRPNSNTLLTQDQVGTTMNNLKALLSQRVA